MTIALFVIALLISFITTIKGMKSVAQYHSICQAYLNGVSFLNLMYREIIPITIVFGERKLKEEEKEKIKWAYKQIQDLRVSSNPIFKPILQSKLILETLIEQLNKEEK